jgi:ribonuclease HI
MSEPETGGDWILYSDGASRGNPGPAGIGAALYKVEHGREELKVRVSQAIGHATNNVAEYRALIAGLRRALKEEPRSLTVRSDSQLLIRQLEGSYRVRNPGLQPLHREALSILAGMRHRLEHVRREENAVADALANAALDRR